MKLSPAFAVAGAVLRTRVLVTLLAAAMVFQALPTRGAPYATPTIDVPKASSGSITLEGWDGVTSVHFFVTDVNGTELDSGVLTSAYYESERLVVDPGATVTLTLFENSAFAKTSVTVAAARDGSLTIHATLTPVPADTTNGLSGNELQQDQLATGTSFTQTSLTGAEIDYTVHVKSSSGSGLAGHMVTLTDSDGQQVSGRTDMSGSATFSLIPGSYDLRIDPYGAHAGTEVTVEVSLEADSTVVTLERFASSGRLTVKTSLWRDDSPLVQVFNGDGVLIGEAQLQVSEATFIDLAHGSDYQVKIAGSRDYQPSALGPFDFSAHRQEETIPTTVRRWKNAYIFVKTSDQSTLPDQVEVNLSIQEWRGTVNATYYEDDRWLGVIEVPWGHLSYSIDIGGYLPVSGTVLVGSSTGHVNIVLEPAPIETPTPTPTPTMVPSPIPTVVPSPTPTVVPSPTPTVVPSPSPTVVPSPTPTVVPSPVPTETPSPTPTAETSPSPTMVPSPTPSPTPTVVPSPTPTIVPSPTPTVEPSPTPTMEPSPSPTVVPSPTPSPSPTVVPSPTPTVVPSPTPTVAPSPNATSAPSPTPTAIITPASTPTEEPTVTPSESPTPSPTPDASMVETPGVDLPDKTVITLETPDQRSLTGAPFELYASMASQSAMAPYLQGVVGAGNRIEIDRLPQGTYRLVVRPADSDPVELTFAADSEEIDVVLRLDDDQFVAGRTDQTATERGMPDKAAGAHESPEAVHEDNVPVVTGLPNTGMSGIREPGMAALVIGTGLLAALFTVVGAFHQRRNH